MPAKVEGVIVAVDPSGDLLTNLAAEALAAAQAGGPQTRIECDEHETFGIFDSTGDLPPQTLAAVIGPDHFLRLTITQENAAELLGIRVGERVVVTW